MNTRRRAARRALILIIIGCVLAGIVPAGMELNRRGWADWWDSGQFQEGLSGD